MSGVESLTRALRVRVQEGRTRRVRRDDDEPILAVLDRLALQRSDWDSATARALARVATESDAGAAAVADFFATAEVAPAWVDTLADLLQAGWQAEVAVSGRHHGGAGPMPAAALLAPLRQRHAAERHPGVVAFTRGRTKRYELGTEAGQDAASDDAVMAGRRRTHGASAPCALGFWSPRTRRCPSLRPALVRQLRRLWAGDGPRGWFCVLEFLAVTPDPIQVAEVTEDLDTGLAEGGAWRSRAGLRFGADEPTNWPKKGWEALPISLPERPSFADMSAFAAERLAWQRATAPVSEE